MTGSRWWGGHTRGSHGNHDTRCTWPGAGDGHARGGMGKPLELLGGSPTHRENPGTRAPALVACGLREGDRRGPQGSDVRVPVFCLCPDGHQGNLLIRSCLFVLHQPQGSGAHSPTSSLHPHTQPQTRSVPQAGLPGQGPPGAQDPHPLIGLTSSSMETPSDPCHGPPAPQPPTHPAVPVLWD